MRGNAGMRGITAFVMMGVASTPSVMLAQGAADSTADTTHRVPGLRNPTTAVVLGAAFPGAGLAYAGEWVGGGRIYLASVGGIGMGAIAYHYDRCMFAFLSSNPCKSGPTWPQHVLGVGLVALGVGTWAYGAVEAKRIVDHNNAERIAGARPTVGSISPSITMPIAPGEPWRVGVHATW